MGITGLAPMLHLNPLSSCRPINRSKYSSNMGSSKTRASSVIGNFEHLFGAVTKDWEFLKNGVNKRVTWVNETLQVPKIVKKVDDAVWLRDLEDPNSPPYESPSWPQPSYPALSGMDLLTADIEALAAYGTYFYCMTKIWLTPLPGIYDAEAISNYFNCRPHIIVIRLLETLVAYAVGQSLSTRPDIIGSEISKALSELHDQIPPFPTAIAMKIIEDELGAPLAKHFSYISDEPIGAASFGQVYRGTTCEGCAVAIKVQRPNLLHLVARDIYILRLGLGLLQKIANRKNDIRLYADELGKGLIGELDYTLEAANATRFLEAHSSFPFIHVPKVFPQLTRKKVLTMEWVVGENPNDLLIASTGAKDNRSGYSEKQKVEAKQHLLDFVSKGVEASLVQLLETGFLHADPHPGNLRYTTTGQIGFLDFGLMCQMERKHQLAMLASIIHIVNGDWASLVLALFEMDVIRPGTSTRLVTMELENSLGEVKFNDGIPDVKFSKVLGKIWSVALKYHFRMPPYFTLLLRSLASLEGLAVAADENFKTFEAAYPYVVRKLLTDDSDASRRILHSVILDKNREFQWQRLILFLRVGATRKCLPKVSESSNNELSSSSSGAGNTFDVTTFVLKLLPSKDGSVLRRLLMTADGSSVLRAFLSKEAGTVRQQLCRAIADILYQWMAQVTSKGLNINASSQTFAASSNYQLLLTDRRLKVVFKKLVNDARRDWLLMLRFCWTSVTMFVFASATASHRLIVSVSETYLSQISIFPVRAIVNN